MSFYTKTEDLLKSKGFNIVFAGNIGHAQNLETLVQSSVILKKKGIIKNYGLKKKSGKEKGATTK